MPVPNQRDPDEIQLLRTLRTGLADLQALVVARWGRVPNQTTDPTSPPDGTVWIRSDLKQMLFRTGGVTYGYLGVPSGGYAEQLSTIAYGAGIADLTGLTVTFTAIAGRRYKVTLFCPEVVQVTTAGLTQTFITDGSNNILNRATANILAGSQKSMTAVYVGTFSAGSTTVKGRFQTSAGTVTMNGATTSRQFILVEDIGT